MAVRAFHDIAEMPRSYCTLMTAFAPILAASPRSLTLTASGVGALENAVFAPTLALIGPTDVYG